MDNKNTPLEGTKLIGFDPISSVSELQIIDLVKGNGDTVKDGDTITAHYTGALTVNGVIFQSSLDFGQPATFGLNQVIAGWTKGVPGMQIGGKRRLIIPAVMAYGSRRASASIPANSDLVFDIELIAIR